LERGKWNFILLVAMAHLSPSPLPFPVLSWAQMGISIIIDSEFKGRLSPAWLRRTARAVLNAEEAGSKAEMGLVITDQRRIRALNKQYLAEDRPTDVLSFPMAEGTAVAISPDGARQLGEVIISYPQALKQAEGRGHSVEEEVALLITHGILHLLGYDHDIPSRKRKLRAHETAILKLIEVGVL